MLYDSEDDPEAKLVGPGPAIHHFGVAVADRHQVLDLIRANGGEILSDPDSGTVKFRSPDGTIAEIADPDRYKKIKGAAGQDRLLNSADRSSGGGPLSSIEERGSGG